MKIRLTEQQYSRLLIENKDFGRLGDTIQDYTIKIFKVLLGDNVKYNKSQEGIIKFIIEYFGLSEHEARIILHTFQTTVLKTDIGDIDSLIGQPLDFIGTYKILTTLPTYICGRTHIPGFVEVSAGSKEEALDKVINGNYSDIYFDENSEEYENPDLDFDMGGDDAEIMDDMVIDYVSDIDWSDKEELNDRVILKI